MAKSRLQTEQKILKAVETLLLEQGYPAVGVNAIARQAGCDKVLIYRYFGGFDGLLLAFAETTQLWWEVEQVMGETAEQLAMLSEYGFSVLDIFFSSRRRRIQCQHCQRSDGQDI